MGDDKTLRVLLADDEEAIIHVYSVGLGHYFASPGERPKVGSVDFLEDELYGVKQAERPHAEFSMCRQGEEAVALVEEACKSGNPFDVVVLDVRMPPGIDGVQAARRIRELDGDVQILFVSGFNDYGREELLSKVPPRNSVGYVEKPVRLSELASKIIAAADRG